MEVAGNGGGGEERGPGALEDGGGASRASPQSPNHGSSQGPHHSGDRSHEGPQDTARSCEGPHRTGTGADEGPRDNARSRQGPRCTGTGADDDARNHETPSCSGIGADEGPQDNARSREGPRRTGTTCSAKGPGLTEGPWDNTRSCEGPRDDARSCEGPRDTATTCSAEGPRGSARSDETPSRTGTGADEDPGNREGPRHPGASADEGPRHTRTTSPAEGPGDSSDEGRRRTGADEDPRHTGAACSTEGPGDSSRSSEGPHRTGTNEDPSHTGAASTDTGPRGNSRSHETPGPGIDELSEGPDVSRDFTAEQRHPGARCAEGPHDPGSQELSDDGERDPNSFKKPVAPGRPGGHEKGLDPRNKPGAPAGDGEAPPNVVGSGLPSDAYRTAPAIPYREPPWSGRPQALYSLEVLKGGAILATKDLSQADWTSFGRLPACHVPLEHPSVSRYHAVLQYRQQPDPERGFYVYDLGSTHGTFLNKQRIPPKTYCRVRVGHVMRFGGSTRLFILQGPEEDQEAESELTVTQIKEVRRQKEDLQKRMLGDDSDEDDEPSEEGKKTQASAGEEAGCMWGMGEDAIEEENEENPIAMEFQEDREASYIKNPKKALQGFFDREGEELEFEYEERSPGSWLCRVKLPADDSAGKQLVAEVTHSGKKKEAANLCSLEACRMLEMRGLLRQEAVSRKRKSKKWEDEDFYDSDDDTFLDRTGIVEKKRLNRMKKAGKIEEKPETFESLSAKLEDVEKEMAEVAAKLKTSHTGVTQPSTQDSLDAFMTEIKAGSSMDSVSRKKLHLQSLELKKEQQRLRSLIKIVQPAKLPELRANPATEDSKPKKLNLPMFGAMKGGSKFKLKTGTVGRLPPKRTDLPASLFTMKDTDEPEEEEEEDEDDQMNVESAGNASMEDRSAVAETAKNVLKIDPAPEVQTASMVEEKQTASPEKRQEVPESSANARSLNGQKKPEPSTKEMPKPAAERPKKMLGPSKPPRGALSTQYPEDDPDYCVWTPPAGQSGDGKTHLNEKYGY